MSIPAENYAQIDYARVAGNTVRADSQIAQVFRNSRVGFVPDRSMQEQDEKTKRAFLDYQNVLTDPLTTVCTATTQLGEAGPYVVATLALQKQPIDDVPVEIQEFAYNHTQFLTSKETATVKIADLSVATLFQFQGDITKPNDEQGKKPDHLTRRRQVVDGIGKYAEGSIVPGTLVWGELPSVKDDPDGRVAAIAERNGFRRLVKVSLLGDTTVTQYVAKVAGVELPQEQEVKDERLQYPGLYEATKDRMEDAIAQQTAFRIEWPYNRFDMSDVHHLRPRPYTEEGVVLRDDRLNLLVLLEKFTDNDNPDNPRYSLRAFHRASGKIGKTDLERKPSYISFSGNPPRIQRALLTNPNIPRDVMIQTFAGKSLDERYIEHMFLPYGVPAKEEASIDFITLPGLALTLALESEQGILPVDTEATQEVFSILDRVRQRIEEEDR